VTTSPRAYLNHIGGEWLPAADGATTRDVNPARTDDVVAVFPSAGPQDAGRAAAAAARAFPAWARTPMPKRGEILLKAAQLLEARVDEVAEALTREEGKTLAESKGETLRGVSLLRYYAGEAMQPTGDVYPSASASTFLYAERVPLGPVALITPWNFPVAIPVWKIAPALVSGNTVVFKPATLTPETGAAIVSIFERAGVPKGVLNMVLGSGGTVGNALLDHEAVRAVSFTGSNDVGSGIYAQAAKRMIRAQCEMGGKNPVVVLADADLDLAVEATAQGAFGSTGQRCTATSRVIVEAEVADAFVERLAARAAKVRIGNGLEAGVDMGPAVDPSQLKTDIDYIGIGQQEGAKLVRGGRHLKEGALAHGHFVEPTVFDHVKGPMRIAQEEIFGPVVSVIRARGFEEALEAANDVRYGLSSSIFTSDVTRVFHFVDGIEAGIVHINSGTPGGEAQLPFGGTKATGVGPREQGPTAIEFFTELKTVYVDYTGQSRKSSIY
jgi:alpha-ketoglutaric semialdehyde dehydrogenase